VATSGDDTNPGTQQSPFRTIQKGINATSAGDTVEVAAGIYRERLTINAANSGTPAKPITVHGAPGAVIDGSDDVSLTWTLKDGYGGGVYTAPLEWETNAVFWGDHSVQEMWWEVAKNKDEDGKWDKWYYERQFTYGIKNLPDMPDYELWSALPQGWNAVRGLAMWKADDKELWVKLMPDGEGSEPLDVSQQPMRVAKADATIITIDGADDIILDGLTLKYGYTGIKVWRSKGCEIKNCVLKPVYNGIRLLEDSDGVSVHNNEYSINSMNRTRTRNECDNVWHQNKDPLMNRGSQDKCFCWMLKCKGNVRIYDNWIHDAAVGVAAGYHTTPEEEKQWGNNIEVAYNLFEGNYQDAFSPGDNCWNNRWHHNVIRNVLQMGRLYSIMHGPLYMYNNICIAGPISINNIVFFADSKGQKPEVYFYHNTTVNALDAPPFAEPGICDGAVYHPNNLPENGAAQVNHHIYNNLFYADRWLKTYASGEDFHWDGDYNVYVRRSDSWKDNVTGDGGTEPPDGQGYAHKQGIDLNSLWTTDSPGFTDFEKGDLSLTAGSPARGRGIDLRERFGNLPGDLSTDCGALPYGAPMLKVPGTSGGAPSAPIISTISPTSGSTEGGTTVTIMGSGMNDATVMFGDTPATDVAVNPSGLHMTCIVPPHAASEVEVRVKTALGTSNALTYAYK